MNRVQRQQKQSIAWFDYNIPHLYYSINTITSQHQSIGVTQSPRISTLVLAHTIDQSQTLMLLSYSAQCQWVCLRVGNNRILFATNLGFCQQAYIVSLHLTSSMSIQYNSYNMTNNRIRLGARI